MEVIVMIVFFQPICFSVQSEAGPSNTIGASSHYSPEKFVSIFISLRIVISQYHIPFFSVFIRHKYIDQNRAVITDPDFHTVFVLQSKKGYLPSV